jgi:hypothetical protein
MGGIYGRVETDSDTNIDETGYYPNNMRGCSVDTRDERDLCSIGLRWAWVSWCTYSGAS